MAVQPSVVGKRAGGSALAEALAIVPAMVLFVALLWLAFASASPNREGGSARDASHAAPAAPNTWPGADAEDPLLILVTFPDERALELQALVDGEAALRELLGEPVRKIDVVAAGSREAAEFILSAIRTDGSFPQLGIHVEGVLVP